MSKPEKVQKKEVITTITYTSYLPVSYEEYLSFLLASTGII
jgi:hypothetical protein